MAPAGGDADAEGRAGRSRRNAQTVEWVLGLASTAMVAALVGFLVFEALNDRTAGPVLVVTVDRAAATPAGWLVPIEVTNLGDTAAADVTVEAGLPGDGGEAERATARFDYVAARSRRSGGLLFTRAPGAGGVSARVSGYSEP